MNLKERAKQLKRDIPAVFLYMKSHETPIAAKILAGITVGYALSPIDLIPDFIPFFGQVDDVFLLLTALQRLITNAGRRVVVYHWTGDPEELADLNIRRATIAAAFFLPPAIRRRLKRVVARGRV